MDTAILWQIGYGGLGGFLIYLVFQGILSLKVFRLQSALLALQGIVLSIRREGYVQKRWNKRDEDEEFIKAALAQPKARAERYANDPLVFDPTRE